MSILHESMSDICYHFTTFRAFNKMLKQNIIHATQGYLGAYGKGDNKNEEKYPFYISTTSTKSFNVGYQQQNNLPIRLTFDGRKLKHKFKIERVSYYNHNLRQSDRKHNNVSGADEMEDRILMVEPSIKFLEYVTSVSINLDKLEVRNNPKINEEISKIKNFLGKYNIELEIIGDLDMSNIDSESDLDPYNETSELELDFFGVVFGLLDKINNKLADQLKTKLIDVIGKPRTIALINQSRKNHYYGEIDKQLNGKSPEGNNKLKRELSLILRNKRNGVASEIALSIIIKLFRFSETTNYNEFFSKYFDKQLNMVAETKDVIHEGMSDLAYHFTSLDVLYKMVKHNKIMGSMAFSDSIESDETLNGGFPFYLSTTSTNSFDHGYGAFIKASVRLTLNGRLIKHNFRVKRVAYNTHSDRMSDMKGYMGNNTDEMEDRILLPKPSLPFNKIVTKCTVVFDDYNDKELIAFAKKEIEKWGIDFEIINSGNESFEDSKYVEDNSEFNSEFTPEVLSFGLAFIDKYDNERLPKLQELMKKCLGDDAENIFEDCKHSEEFYILYYMEEIMQKCYVENGFPETHRFHDFITYLEYRLDKYLSKFNRESTLDEYVVTVMGQKLRKYRITNTKELIAWTYKNVTGEDLE